MMGEWQSEYGTGKGSSSSHISVGPWGGQTGARWDDGVYTAVRQVIIFHGAAIDSVQFEYDKKGSSVWSEKHGGTGGIKTNKVKLECPEEYLVSISGHYGGLVEFGPPLVRSIVLESNRKKYGPFGIQQGTHFSVPVAGAKVVGFHGRSSWYLDSIGVHLTHPSHQNSLDKWISNIPQGFPPKLRGFIHDYNGSEVETRTKEIITRQQMDNGSAPISNGTVKSKQAGPWGGSGGATFNDGVYTGVREIHLTRSKGVVTIWVCYDLNGNAVWGEQNGGTGGIRLDRIGFDYPSEILTHITGYYGSTFSRGPTIVRSITFHTNRRKYGPFGDEQGTCFTSASNNGKVVGFHGRKGNFLDSIGVHVMEGTKSPSRTVIQRSAYDDSSISMIKGISLPQEHVILPSANAVMVKEQSYGRAAPATWRSGAWGGERGKEWDDGVFNGVTRIFLTRGEAIYCIQVQYDSNGGQFVWSPRHGSGSEGNSQMIKFDYPQEFLTAVTGYHGSLTGDEKSEAIHCLTFYTNKGKYGPYGKETGTFFTSGESKGKIVGFHGRSGCYLNALGVHLQQQQHQSSVTQRDLEPLMAGDSGGGRASKVIVGKFIKSNIFSTFSV